MEKLTIKNRKDRNIVVLIEEHPSPEGLVFIAHGSGGFKEQPHIQALADAFKNKGFTCNNLTIKPFLVKGAMYAVFNKYGLTAAYTN